VLAAQREAMGWTVEQVADQLKLAVRQVVALEAGDYASLPSPAVTRGFVRAYAKLVRVDPAPLVAQIAIESEAPAEANPGAMRRPSPASFSQAKFPSHGKRSLLPLGWIVAAVAVAAVAGGAWHFGLIPLGQHAETATVAAPAASAPAAAETHGSATETLQNPSVPLISVPGPASAQADAAGGASAPAAAAAPAAGPVVNVPGTTATGAPPTTVPAAPANPVATQSPAQAAAATAPAAAQAAAGAGVLVFTVREDAWIEVRPAKGGKDMIKRLVRAGSTETLNIDQPVRIIVGNPGAVSASLRGAPVALPPVPGKTYSLVNVQ
jgi:cytoskeleton protein RodZ